MAGTGDNQTPQFWEDFYASIYGEPDEPEPAETIQSLSTLSHGSSIPEDYRYNRLSNPGVNANAPTRLAANVGTPAGAGVPLAQVAALGAGLGNSVNALGYRVTEPVKPAPINPAVAAINTATPPVASVAPAVQRKAPAPQRGIAPAPVPTWIASMAPQRSVSAVQQLRDQGMSGAEAYAAANANAAQRARDGASSPSHQSSSSWFNEVTDR